MGGLGGNNTPGVSGALVACLAGVAVLRLEVVLLRWYRRLRLEAATWGPVRSLYVGALLGSGGGGASGGGGGLSGGGSLSASGGMMCTVSD